MELELDCDLLNKGIAEKELLLIKSRQLRPRKESTAASLAPGPMPTHSFAKAVKSGKLDRAVLVVKAAANTDQSTVNRKYFNKPLGFKMVAHRYSVYVAQTTSTSSNSLVSSNATKPNN